MEVERRLKSPESLEKDDFIGCFYREMEKRKNETEKHTFTSKFSVTPSSLIIWLFFKLPIDIY